jgi:hypothetical protein
MSTSDTRQQSLWHWQVEEPSAEAGGRDPRPARDASALDAAVSEPAADEPPVEGALSLDAQVDRQRHRQRQARRLHTRLSSELGRVDLHITDNRRRMITVKRRPSRVELRLHHMFLGCSEKTLVAVARFARGDNSARETIQRYIDDHRDAIRHEVDPSRLRHEGDCYDLAELLDIQRARFQGVELDDIHITWGRDGKGRRSIRFGSYDYDRRIIRIHPALDAEWVPEYFVAFIVYHELCHAVIPPREEGSRRLLHPPEFRELERHFPQYEEAVSWEEDNLHRFLDRD